MLRLVDACPVVAGFERVRHVAFFGLDNELAVYIERRLRLRWSGVVVHRLRRSAELDPDVAEILISGVEPDAEPRVPTLWLGDVEHSCRPYQVNRMLWKSATPITGRPLIQVIERMLIARQDIASMR